MTIQKAKKPTINGDKERKIQQKGFYIHLSINLIFMSIAVMAKKRAVMF